MSAPCPSSPSSFALWYCLAWLQSLRQFELCMSDFPKVLTIVEEEVFIWVPEAAKEDATMTGESLSFETGNLNVNYSLLCSSNESMWFNWANEHSAYMCPTCVHWLVGRSNVETNLHEIQPVKMHSSSIQTIICKTKWCMLCNALQQEIATGFFPNATLWLNPAHCTQASCSP